MFRLIGTLTIEKIMADTAIMLDWLDREGGGGRIGALGYCMSSQFAIRGRQVARSHQSGGLDL
jgi:dienelactone hydrolase